MFSIGGGGGRDAQLQANRERAFQTNVTVRENEHKAFMIVNEAMCRLDKSVQQICDGIAGSCSARNA